MPSVLKRLLERKRGAASRIRIPYLSLLERKTPPIPFPLEINSRLAVQWRQSMGDPHKKMWTHGLFNRGKSSIVRLEDGGATYYSKKLRRHLKRVMRSRIGNTMADLIKFWQLQWFRYGSFFGVMVNGYFYVIVYLHKMLPKDVRDMGLRPGIQSSVRVLRRRIHHYFGVKPEIQGFSESRAKGGKVIVYELIFSINKNVDFINRNSKPFSGNISSLDSLVTFPV